MRFNLQSLPYCGAKTRRGTKCKRRGNMRSGRCKLHGGQSTGPKTEEGKLISKTNAIKDYCEWSLNNGPSKKTYKRAHTAFRALLTLMDLIPDKDEKQDHQIHKHIEKEVIKLVDAYRLDLERIKYSCSPEGFVFIQAALDRYYKEKGSVHLAFHAHTGIVQPPYFHHTLTKFQLNVAMKFYKRY